ncbi:MAG: tRNA (cytidine/uridine-2'-O-)-methyltransferase [Paracoccaceae bacterium]|jgi:tRNA (cytidine/uridine-2'-O-)-methyltransferase
MRIALYQPDIPQNAGAIFRLAACLGIPVDVIEPCGFVLDDRRLRRVAMDYGGQAEIVRHPSWENYTDKRTDGRVVLLTTTGSTSHIDFAYEPSDTLLLGRESAGVPDNVHAAADARLIVPMADGARSLNVVTATAMVLGEALRQTGGYSELSEQADT